MPDYEWDSWQDFIVINEVSISDDVLLPHLETLGYESIEQARKSMMLESNQFYEAVERTLDHLMTFPEGREMLNNIYLRLKEIDPSNETNLNITNIGGSESNFTLYKYGNPTINIDTWQIMNSGFVGTLIGDQTTRFIPLSFEHVLVHELLHSGDIWSWKINMLFSQNDIEATRQIISDYQNDRSIQLISDGSSDEDVYDAVPEMQLTIEQDITDQTNTIMPHFQDVTQRGNYKDSCQLKEPIPEVIILLELENPFDGIIYDSEGFEIDIECQAQPLSLTPSSESIISRNLP